MAEPITDEQIDRSILRAKMISITLSRDGIIYHTDGVRGTLTSDQAERVFALVAGLARTNAMQR